ncbi:MAG: hypothetical protein ACTSRP_09475 [Candidatus Helarchaeota archaeon]
MSINIILDIVYDKEPMITGMDNAIIKNLISAIINKNKSEHTENNEFRIPTTSFCINIERSANKIERKDCNNIKNTMIFLFLSIIKYIFQFDI